MSDWATECLSDAPVLLLKMDEASGNLTDHSGHGHGATVTGSPTYAVASGLAGVTGGITFASGQFFTVADHSDLDLGDGPLTVEVWYKRGTTSDSGDLLGKADGSATAGYIVNQSSTDFLRWENGATSSNAFPNSGTFLDNTTIHHAVFTKLAGAFAKVYIDGSDVSDTGNALTFIDNAQDLLIGKGYSAGSTYAGLTLYGVAIYKGVALSGSRVTAHYAGRLTAPTTSSTYWDVVLADSPKVLLKLDEASGNAADSSGNAHHATANGSPLYRVAGPTSSIPWAITYPSGAYHSIADTADIDLGDGPFTIEGWMRRPTPSANGDILGKADGTATAGYIVNMSATDFLRLEDGSTSSHVYNADPVTLDDAAWHHFAFTRASATNAKLYIDAVDVTSLGGAKTFADNAQALLIGRGFSTGSSSGMTLAGITIYKSELSSARIAAHYAARDSEDVTPPASTPSVGFRTLRTFATLRTLR